MLCQDKNGRIKVDNQQAHFIDITEELDHMYDVSDRNFILWYLLGDYRRRISEEEILNREAVDIKEYAIKRMILDHMKAIEEIRDVLQEEIF